MIKRFAYAGNTRVLGYEEWEDGELIARRYRSPSGKVITVDEWPEDETWEPTGEAKCP